MNRFLSMVKCDIRFQYRYGFYWLYLFFVVFYAAILAVLPPSVQIHAAAVLVYTDPAAMGLFFMGAIVLFEKSQRVIEPLSVSPITVDEYILSKALSISIVSLISSWIIALSLLVSGTNYFLQGAEGTVHFMLFSISLLLSSFMFTCAALICASHSRTLNQFMIFTVPFELFLMIPPMAHIFGFSIPIMEFHPGVIALRLFLNDSFFHPAFALLLIGSWLALFYLSVRKAVTSMFFRQGGIQL